MSCFIVEAGSIFARELGEVVEVAIVFTACNLIV